MKFNGRALVHVSQKTVKSQPPWAKPLGRKQNGTVRRTDDINYISFRWSAFSIAITITWWQLTFTAGSSLTDSRLAGRCSTGSRSIQSYATGSLSICSYSTGSLSIGNCSTGSYSIGSYSVSRCSVDFCLVAAGHLHSYIFRAPSMMDFTGTLQR